MGSNGIYDMISKAKPIGGVGGGDIQIAWKDIFPTVDDKPVAYCPFQPAHTIPEKSKGKILMVRIYQPCFKEKCAFRETCKPNQAVL